MKTATATPAPAPERRDLVDLLEQASSALNDRGDAFPADFEAYALMRTLGVQLAEIVGGQLVFGMTFRHYGPGYLRR